MVSTALRRHRGPALAVGLLVGGTAEPAMARSQYTDLLLGECHVIEEYEDGGFDARCPGLDGVEVFVREADGRTSVSFGAPADAAETFSAFNTLAERVEWRFDGDRPTAAIVRFRIDADGRGAEALAVSRIATAQSSGCTVGVVDAAEEEANGVARGFAALAPFFECGTDTPPVLSAPAGLVAGFIPANR